MTPREAMMRAEELTRKVGSGKPTLHEREGYVELEAILRAEAGRLPAESGRDVALDILRRAVAWHTPGFLPPKPIDEHWLDDARRALKSNADPQEGR